MLQKNVEIKEHDYHGKVYYAKKSTKIKTAVRLFCAECMGMCRTSPAVEIPVEDIRACTDKMCPLFEFRLGLNPYKAKSRVEAGHRLVAEGSSAAGKSL